MKQTRNYLIAKHLINQFKLTGKDNMDVLIKLQDMFNELTLEEEQATLELIVEFFQEINRNKEKLNYIHTNYLALA